MGDLFHEDVPFSFIEKIWDTMFDTLYISDDTPGIPHVYMILTKRPDRMAEFYQHMNKIGRRANYENVWLGVTAENQKAADDRIPILLKIPAAVRFVSYEPALGPVDWGLYLTGVYECVQCLHREVNPQKECMECGHIGDNAGEEWGNGPTEICPECGTDEVPHEVCERCTEIMVAHHPETPVIDLLIAGGESGPGARPAHPDWFRSARDQCLEAGTAFFFKQWNVGKNAAGRELDGREWNEMPGGGR